MTIHQCPECKILFDCPNPICNDLSQFLCNKCQFNIIKKSNDMERQFIEDTEAFKKTHQAITNKQRRKEIPYEIVPSLIRVIYKNIERFRKDAEILFNAKSYETSVVRLFDTQEELSKLSGLLTSYKKHEKTVSLDKVKRLFGSHHNKLEESERRFTNNFFRENDRNDFTEWLLRNGSIIDQNHKENLTYTDWLDGEVHDPINFGEIAKYGRNYVIANLIQSYKITLSRIISDINELQSDPDFQKIMNEPTVDRKN